MMKQLRGIMLAAILLLATIFWPAEAQSIFPKPSPQTFSAPGTYNMGLSNIGTVSIRVSGTCTGLTAAFQVSNDGTNFTTLPLLPVGSGASVTSITAPGFWTASVNGITGARVNITALTASCTFSIGGTQASLPLNAPTYVYDLGGNIQGLNSPSGTVPLSVQTSIASLGLLPLPSTVAVSGDATNGVIFNSQFPALSSFYGCKLILANFDTVNPMSIDGLKVAPAPKSISGGNSSLTWSSFVTVNGSQSFTVPVAVTGAGGQLIPGIVVTDFVPVTSTARTDTVGAPFLLRTAMHIAPSANQTVHPNYNGTNYNNLNALSGNPGLIYGSYNFAGTGATLAQLTSTGATTTTGYGANQPLGVMFYYNTVHPDIWEFGDSRVQGQGTTTTMAGLTEYVAFNSYGKPTQFGGMNFATSGQKTVDTLARLKTVLTAGAASGQLPKYALFMSWSPNDVPHDTQSTYDTTWGYVLEMINFCIQKGVQPIVATGPFANGYQLSYIQTQNARVMALPATVRKVDLFNLWTPGGTWVSAYNSGDGVHPNDAGESAGANAILSTVTY